MAVSIYTTPSCGYCQVAKKYFRERGVKFTEFDITRDQRKADEMLHKSRQGGVPVIDFNGEIIVGFDQGRLERLISKSNN
ncbi:MAG: glutathione S-transferase N-terminal domain-containing protein [Spirochaetales bacterium]|nr:glutathione S-transferase N-terminal domain-containing protein [Spirochaetales bacterium]